MNYKLDPELAPAMAALAAQAVGATPPARGDRQAVRTRGFHRSRLRGQHHCTLLSGEDDLVQHRDERRPR